MKKTRTWTAVIAILLAGCGDLAVAPLADTDVAGPGGVEELWTSPAQGVDLGLHIPNLITVDDSTALDSIRSVGKEKALFWIHDDEEWTDTLSLFLFDAFYDTLVFRVEAHPDYGSADSALAVATRTAAAVGRLPHSLFAVSGREIEIYPGKLSNGHECLGIFHIGTEVFNGTYYGQALLWVAGLVSLTTCDHPEPRTIPRLSGSPAWLAAQEADGFFITPRARAHPETGDVAETTWAWFAARCVPERVNPWFVWGIETYIPHRLDVMDALPLLGCDPF